MAEALFGLIGVVIGGLITAGVEERRRRADARDRRRVAARAIHSELLSAQSAIVTALEEHDTRSLVAGRHVGDAGAAWREHGAGLGDISVKDWIVISQAVVAADSFPWGALAPGTWREDLNAGLGSVRDQLRDGMDAVWPYTK